MPSTPPQPLPPDLPPLGNIAGSDNLPLELAHLVKGSSANIDTFEDEFLRSLPTHVDSDDSEILDGNGVLATINQTPNPSRRLFNNGIEETPPNVRVAVNKAAAALTNLACFPSNYGMVENRFTNQDEERNAEGYDSKGNLPHFADAAIDDDEELYCEECIGGDEWGGEAAAAVDPAAAQLDVMKLSVAQLKAELKKRGRATAGNKSVLQVRLKEAIDLNVPVSDEAGGGNEASRPDFIAGLDVTARWELLTRCNDPIPEPENNDGSLRPPTEMSAAINPSTASLIRSTAFHSPGRQRRCGIAALTVDL
ncbi:MAG: SAP domain-containing protein [Sphaerospermopsis kisseleviana]